MKKIRQLIEFLIVLIIFSFLKLIPINLVSVLGGKFFKIIGPYTRSHNVALNNYKRIFKNINEKQIKKDVAKSWENLGKTFIEFSIIDKILKNKNNRIKIIGKKNIEKIKENNEQVIFFGIHQANWELLVPTITNQNISIGAIYRHINNPFIDEYILNIRKKTILKSKSFFTPKGKESAKDIIEAINKNLSMLLLIDQKDTAGKNINFFNINTKTQTGFLKIARKYKLRLLPVQTIREKINNFSIIFHPAINIFDGDLSDDEAMKKVHGIIEKWILEKPSQWFWQHKRFD